MNTEESMAAVASILEQYLSPSGERGRIIQLVINALRSVQAEHQLNDDTIMDAALGAVAVMALMNLDAMDMLAKMSELSQYLMEHCSDVITVQVEDDRNEIERGEP